MNSVEQPHSLSTFRPARLNPEQTAEYLNFARHDIPVLIRHGLLRPLGHPRPSAVKYFALVVLERYHADVNWLSRATDAVYGEWRRKNASKKKRGAASPAAKDKPGHQSSAPRSHQDALGDGSES